MKLPFGRTKALEKKVDGFLDTVATGMLAFREGIEAYLVQDEEAFERLLGTVSDLERRADELSREIETDLYTYSLIPDQRGDVLSVIEEMDDLLDWAKAVMQKFEVEIPSIPEVYRQGYRNVLGHSVHAAHHAICAARSYFRDPSRVKEDLTKVEFYESEADEAALRLKREIYRSELELAERIHLRYFAERVESLSDFADDVAKTLAIATIKRSV
jgi:predicted phosphate transport protein (TIGR00153 family)